MVEVSRTKPRVQSKSKRGERGIALRRAVVRAVRGVLAISGTFLSATVLASVIGRTVKNFTSSLPAGKYTAAAVWLGVCIGAVVIGFLRVQGTHEDSLDAEVAAEPILDRIEELRRQLAESAKLLPALQAELELRTTALAALKEDAVHYEQLAALHQEQAAAVQRLVEQTIAIGNTRAQQRNWRQQWAFWLVTLVVGIPVGLLGNYIYALIRK